MGSGTDNSTDPLFSDAHRPTEISLRQAAELDGLQCAYAADLARSLSDHLGKEVSIFVGPIDHLRYAEFVAGSSIPTCLSVLRIDPPGAQACLEMSPQVIFPMIDALLGGNRSIGEPVPHRALTQIEQGLALQIVERAAGQLADKLSGLMAVLVKEEELVSDPAQIRLMPSDEVITVMRFEVQFGDSHGVMRLGLPAPVLDLIAQTDSLPIDPAPAPAARGHNTQDLTQNIMQSAVELRALLAETKLRLSEVLALQEGDIITTEIPADSPIPLRLNEQNLRFGRLAQFNGRRVIELSDRRPDAPAGGQLPS